ncbi:hypothetical protein CAter10_1721 [Collimonas arenae]|nr:hypothetical protein CAter10_1721 [Collimonas arenae]
MSGGRHCKTLENGQHKHNDMMRICNLPTSATGFDAYYRKIMTLLQFNLCERFLY